MIEIKLSVPEYLSHPNPPVETRPKQLKEWLDALPLANGMDAGRKLADAMAALNRIKLADDARIKLLDLYRASAQMLSPSLQQLFVGKPLPLQDKHKQAANLLREMFTELAHGYKRALLDMGTRRMSFGTNKLLPLAIARAIESLGVVLDVYYETYRPSPADVWFELNQLYWYAARQNLHEQAIAEDTKVSVNQLYKQVLLIALADPYRLHQGQLAEVKTYLAKFAKQAELQPLGKADNTHGLFLVRLDGDKPPKALANHSGVTDGRTDIILNTIPLARMAHQHLQDMDADIPLKKIGLPDAAKQPGYREMLKRLIKQWGIAPKRIFNRTSAHADLLVCGGISSLHHALSQGIDAPVQNTESGVKITVQVSDPTTDEYQAYNCANWQVLNESAGGVALSKDPGSAAKIKVGDLIGLSSNGAEGSGIAIVRWMQSTADNMLELGAQMLAPHAEAVAIKPVIAAADALFQPALLLPAVPALNQPECMVAARGSFQAMREFEVQFHGTTRSVRAQKLVEQTDSLDLFFFS